MATSNLQFIDCDDYDIESLEHDDDDTSVTTGHDNGVDYDDESFSDDESYDCIRLIQQNTKIDDPEIERFITFCKRKKLFDDTFYDYCNVFSLLATRLPDTFKKIAKNKKLITKNKFTSVMHNKLKFKGNAVYIYNLMDVDDRGYIDWDDFKEFFLPFVKNVTI